MRYISPDYNVVVEAQGADAILSRLGFKSEFQIEREGRAAVLRERLQNNLLARLCKCGRMPVNCVCVEGN